MTEISVFLIVAIIIVVSIYFWRKYKKKSANSLKRTPYRVNDINGQRVVSLDSAHRSSVRKPRKVDDFEYLKFRNCPRCHSENERNHQVIFKLSQSNYVCKNCGNRFTF